MRKFGIFFIFLVVFISHASAQNKGLHNYTGKRFIPKEKMRAEYLFDPKEMKRTWMAAYVRIPTKLGKSRRIRVSALEKIRRPKRKFPTVIFMHGCAGLWSGTFRRVQFLADNGFLVIAPASLARKKYVKSCDPRTHKGGLYRGAVVVRQLDAGFAIETARKLPVVDGDRIVLMGLSEGGITTASFVPKNENQKVLARVIEGWTCHTGWSEQRGLNAPQKQPVLSLVGARDPWFQTRWLRGDCGKFMSKNGPQKSIVYRKGTLARKHELLDYRLPRKEVLRFLRQYVLN